MLSNYFLFTVFTLIILCFGTNSFAKPYDYSFTSECLAKPLVPQYNGGVVLNPELNEGLMGWRNFGDSKVEHAESRDGNSYIIASSRSLPYHSFSQEFNLDKDKLYTFSAWFQVSHGSADIAAIFKTQTSYETAGWVSAKSGCWSMLKGGLVVNSSGRAQLFFQSNNTSVDIWADSISLQPFSQDEWKWHQYRSIKKARKTKVRLQAVDQHGRPVANATVNIKQQQSSYPFGCAINQNLLGNDAYQNWFSSRFKYTVFENELKWYSTERSRGVEDYSVADALVNFCKSHGIAIRGHNIFWNDPYYQMAWVAALPPNELAAATDKRVNSVVSRYRGQLFHWDVVNENMHFRFFEERLGPSSSTNFYQKAHDIDGGMTPFLNDYNTIEDSNDVTSSPQNYLKKIAQLRREGYNGPLGIGLEAHFSSTPNPAYIRSAIDVLASARLPIWVTELDIESGPNQATYLDQVLRELHSHPAIQGILLWSGWRPQPCKMCLTDDNFRNLATGDVVDKFRSTLSSEEDSYGTTDSDGFFEASLFHGEYEANITHPAAAGIHFSDFQTFQARPNKRSTTVEFKIHL